MENLIKEKITAIVPALNEETTVGNVLSILLGSKCLDEVILVDDGSSDKTAEIGEKLGVKVVKLPKIGGSGKGNAMRQGAMATNAKIIVFFDADLLGLTTKHVDSLVIPVSSGQVSMCVGIRNRLFGLPKIIARLDPIMAVGGERAIRKELFEKIPDKFMHGFMVESALNYYCKYYKIPVKYAVLENLKIVIKEKKWGFVKGFVSRIKMMFEIFKIRSIFIFYNFKNRS